MEYLYVCHFSNGHIKVGRSIDPKSRIAAHVERVACMGVELVEHHVAGCAGHSKPAEAMLIEHCTIDSTKRNKSEWFEGLDYETVKAFAIKCANMTFEVGMRGTKEPYVMTEKDIESIRQTREFIKRCRYQYKDGLWTDTKPEQAHWPDSSVCRWDLRQTDWHKIWPELESHPCSLLFAPKHPKRDGAPKFRDWVASWPSTVRPAVDFPSLNQMILQWGEFSRQELRPDDFWNIWPDLAHFAPVEASQVAIKPVAEET